MAQPSLNNKSPEGNPRAASTRIQSKNVRALAGQRKHDKRIGRQPVYVDESRKHLNRTIIEPDPPDVMRAICESRRSLRDTIRKMKKDASVSGAGIITFGSEAAALFEALTPEAQDGAFLDLAESIADRLNTTLHGLVVHRDETTIHAHYQIASYNLDGVPLSQATRPAVMSGLQDLTAEVMARHCPGIERGNRYGDRIKAGADFRDTLHRTVRELHRDLPKELESKRAEIARLDAAKQEVQARVDEMRERVQKLEAKAELSDKETKRLETYRKRLEARIAEQEAAQQAAERLASISQDEAERAAQEREEAEADKRKAVEKVAKITSALQVLSEEIAGETIQRSDNGKILVKNQEGLIQGFPEIKPALLATADAMSAKKRIDAENAADRTVTAKARKRAEADQQAAAKVLTEAQIDRAAAANALKEAETLKAEAETLRARLKRHLGVVRVALQHFSRFLKPDEAKATETIIKEAEVLTDPPKKPGDQSGGDAFAM